MRKRKPLLFTDAIYDTARTRTLGANAAKELSKIHRGIPISAAAAFGSDCTYVEPFSLWSSRNQGKIYVKLDDPIPFEVYESGRKVKFDGTELPNDDRAHFKVMLNEEIHLLLPRQLMTNGECPKEVTDLVIKGLKDGSITLWLDTEVGE